MGLCPLPLYLDGHVFLHMAEVILCPKLAWKEFSFCFAGWNAAFWSSQSSYKKCETLRTPQQEGALTRPWVEPTKDAKGSRRSEPAALVSCILCYSHQHLIATVWGSVSQTQPSGPLTNSSQRRRDNKIGTAGFAANSRKHNIWCSGNHLLKKKNPHPTTIS